MTNHEPTENLTEDLMETATSLGKRHRSPASRRPLVAYLMLTHKNVQQVEALVARILDLSPDGHVVVHHDLDADGLPWNGSVPSRAHLVERSTVEWGSWSIVRATLRMIGFALEELGADWIIVVSGEHWPVTDLAKWERALDRSGADAFLPAVQLPRRLQFGRRNLDGNRFLARCIHQWGKIDRPQSSLVHRALSGISKVTLLTHPILKLEFSLRSDAWFVGVPRRKGPVKQWNLFKGSEWIACNARAAQTLLEVDSGVASWFERSHIPDESYFQSVLHHTGELVIKDSLVTWVPAEPKMPTDGWMLLKIDDLPTVMATGSAFARKVDLRRNPDVITAIDAEVDRSRSDAGAATVKTP